MAAIWFVPQWNGCFHDTCLGVRSRWRMYPMTCSSCGIHQSQGWGLQSQFPPFRYFPNFSASPKYMLAIVYHVHIWQVLPQLSCGDTCQIWMWCKQSNRYFDRIKSFAYGEINERSFSNPHLRYCWCGVPCIQCLYLSSSLYTRHACNNIPLERSNISLKWERTYNKYQSLLLASLFNSQSDIMTLAISSTSKDHQNCIQNLHIGWVYMLHCEKWYGFLACLKSSHNNFDIDGIVQERRNSSALTMELCLSCTKPSILCLRLCDWMSLQCWVHEFTTCPLCVNSFVCQFTGKSISNKLVCKFDRVGNSLILIMWLCIDSNYWYILLLWYFKWFYFHFDLLNSF